MEYDHHKWTRASKAEYDREWIRANPDRRREIQRRYHAKKKLRALGCSEVKQRKHYKRRDLAHREPVRRSDRPKPEICELCDKSGIIAFDHCHGCGAFRGWLCRNCNLALGLTRDNPNLLRRMADYVEQHSLTSGHQGRPDAAPDVTVEGRVH